MCGVWLAFEDVDDENGPLFYYPGSHRWPSYQNEHLGVSYVDIRRGFPEYRRYVALWDALVEKQGLKREVFRPKKGQALIWTSNLLHGGSVQVNHDRTRWSQVTHYFFEGCAYTTPVANDAIQGKITFRDITDIRSGDLVPNVVSGASVRGSFREAIKAEFDCIQNMPATKMEVIQIKIAKSRFQHDLTLPPGFDPIAYVKANPDLIEAQVDPFEHYLAYGQTERRRLR